MKRAKPPSPEPVRRPRERKLTPDEADLWAQVASSVTPEKKAKPRVRRKGAAAGDRADTARPQDSTEKTAAPVPEAGPPARARSSPAAASYAPTAAPTKAKVPALAEFDRRKARQISRGRAEIDARLDLHGLRQSEARHRLVGFLHSAQARGSRTVLVITGKGSRAPVDPLAHALGQPERGVLRRLVPQWLGEPDLRALVVSFTTASIRHGGDGALYVHLRRTDR